MPVTKTPFLWTICDKGTTSDVVIITTPHPLVSLLALNRSEHVHKIKQWNKQCSSSHKDQKLCYWCKKPLSGWYPTKKQQMIWWLSPLYIHQSQYQIEWILYAWFDFHKMSLDQGCSSFYYGKMCAMCYWHVSRIISNNGLTTNFDHRTSLKSALVFDVCFTKIWKKDYWFLLSSRSNSKQSTTGEIHLS